MFLNAFRMSVSKSRTLFHLRALGHTKCMGFKNFSTSITRSEKSYTENLEQFHRNGVRFGQPTQFSHPHLLKPNELATGIQPGEFAERRHKLVEKITEHCVKDNKPSHNIVIIPASVKKYMTGKIPYFFRQNTDFYYLTGCLEPESVLVLWSDGQTSKSSLFMRPKNNHDELWDGPRTGAEYAVDMFGVDEAYPLYDLTQFIERNLPKTKSANVWYDLADEIQPSISTKLRPILPKTTLFQPPIEFLHELRLIKSPAEIELMRQTCEIASNAVNLTMQQSKAGDSEHHIYDRVDFHCRMNNAQFLAYPPVVAAGNNANVIHYINNTQVAKDGELVLMDAGCEYGGYSSDITRTWPVNGKFTPAQEMLYDVVLTIQKELLSVLSNVENVTLDQLYDLMCYRLGKYLQEIGVIKKSLNELDAARYSYKFCPHHVSHYLGMDIHDTALIARNRVLQPGTVFTVEPGLYIPADCSEVPEEFRGIGIRIEDDILYTNEGADILTKNCIKDISELKKLLTM